MEYTSPPIIQECAKLLSEPIPPASEDWEGHLIAIQALQYPVAATSSDLLQLLYEKRKQLLWPKDKDLTELDRHVRMNADVAPIDRDYQLLTKIEKLIELRITVIMQLLELQ